MSLTLPVVDESGPVRDGARSLLNVYMGVVDVTDEIASTWAGLSTAYSTPEAPDVLDAMTQPGTCARTLAADADGACAALLAYADRLDELKTLREQLTADIAAHEAKAAATSQASTQSDDPTAQQHQQNLLRSEAVALEGRVARFIQALEEAQQECSSKIHAAQGGATHVGGGVATLTGGGPGLIPIEPDPRFWDVGQARDGRFRSGTNQEEHHESSGAMGLGAPVPGESAPMPRPDPWQYPGDSEGEGSGPHAQRGANLGDHLKHEAATSAAYGMAPFWPDASRNLFHFLNNSGKPLDMNTNGMLNDLPELRDNTESDLQQKINDATTEAKASGYTGPVTYPFVTNWTESYADKSENQNWFYATGGYHYATAGTITVYPDGSYKYAYQVHTADRYNWDGDKKTGIGPLTIHDTELQELHRAGIAQEFDLVGESSVRTGP